MTVFWSRAHPQRHVTICLMKFAVGEWNIAIRYSFCVWLCNMNTVIRVDSICRERRERETSTREMRSPNDNCLLKVSTKTRYVEFASVYNDWKQHEAWYISYWIYTTLNHTHTHTHQNTHTCSPTRTHWCKNIYWFLGEWVSRSLLAFLSLFVQTCVCFQYRPNSLTSYTFLILSTLIFIAE